MSPHFTNEHAQKNESSFYKYSKYPYLKMSPHFTNEHTHLEMSPHFTNNKQTLVFKMSPHFTYILQTNPRM